METTTNTNPEEIKENEEPTAIPTEEAATTEENHEDDSKPAINPDDPTDEESELNIRHIIKQAREMCQILESQWCTSKEEFKLTDTHMKTLYKYNEEHRQEMPDNLSEQEQQEWDHFNGLDQLTEQDVLDIFGEEHPIIGVMHTQTLGRVKEVVNDFFSWTMALREYNNVNDAYMSFLEEKEEHEMNKLRVAVNNEKDPEKKAKFQEAIDTYYNRKYLGFLAEQQDEKKMDRIAKAFFDSKKIEYWLNRTQDKLEQLKISTKFILEISQFEKRFLPEKYHRISNVLLLYFMNLVVFSNMGDPKDNDRNKALCMIFALDGVVRNKTLGNQRETILNNIMTLLDMFLGKIPEQKDEK